MAVTRKCQLFYMLFITISLAVAKLVLCNEHKIMHVEPDINENENKYSVNEKIVCVLDNTNKTENNSSGEEIEYDPQNINCETTDFEKIGHICSVPNDFILIVLIQIICDAKKDIATLDEYDYILKKYTDIELHISSGFFMTHKSTILLEELTRLLHRFNELIKSATISYASESLTLGLNTKELGFDLNTVLEDLRYEIEKEYLHLNITKMELEAKTNIFYHVLTPILVIMLIFGLIGNSLLLIMFVRHVELRTSQNILIINLVICDLLNILINLMFNYALSINHVEQKWNPGHGTCKTIIQFLYTSVGLSTWSVVALSVQRFFVIMMPLRSHTSKNCLSQKQLTLIYVISVWVLAIGLALPSSVPSEMDVFGYCSTQLNARFLSLWNLMWYSLLPPVIVAVNYTLTAWRLAAEIKNLPEHAETQRRGRKRSARVLLALTVVFMVSYLPLFLFFFLDTWDIIDSSLEPDNMDSERDFIIGSIIRVLFFSNSALNPIALFVSSNVFRKYLKPYSHCYQNQHEGNQNNMI